MSISLTGRRSPKTKKPVNRKRPVATTKPSGSRNPAYSNIRVTRLTNSILSIEGLAEGGTGGNMMKSSASMLPPMAIRMGKVRALNNSSSAQKSSRMSCVAKPYARNKRRNAEPMSRLWIITILKKLVCGRFFVEPILPA